MEKAPAWQRVLGGAVGIAILVVAVLVARDRGVSGAEMQHWEEVLAFSALAAAGVVWLLRRYRRQR